MFPIQGPVQAVPVWGKEQELDFLIQKSMPKASPNPHYKDPAEALSIWAQ